MTMQTSEDRRARSRPSVARRWGPIAAVLAVIVGVTAFALVSGDDDEPGRAGGTDAGTGDGGGDGGDQGDGDDGGGLPEGVVTWSMAQEQDLDATFPDTCDRDSGMIAIPFVFRTECFADVDDNGGRTARGVTADSIKVVVWLPAADDPVRGLLLDRIGFDASNAELRETYEGFIEIFQRYYQTYGRTVEVQFLEASASILDNVAARADAVRAAEDMGAFAVLGGPVIGSAWTEELHARRVVCLACPGISEPEPSVFSVPPSGGQIRSHLVAYVSQKLAGGTADFAGDDLQGEERVFGHLKLGMSDSDEQSAERLRDELAEHDVEIVEQILYPLDPGRSAELATNAVTRMQSAGVTTVILESDPILLPAFTQEATKQGWFPEWLLAGSPFVDTSAFGRTFDQQQWQHAFGFSFFPPQVAPRANPPARVYNWFHGESPPVDGALPLLLIHPQVTLFFTGLQYAGPDLNVRSFRDGLFAMPPTPTLVTQPSASFGHQRWSEPDYAGVDDMVELWWDPDASGPDEAGNEGEGMYRYVDGGKRYLVDDWPDELRVFEREGSVTVIDDPPEDELPPDYPPPS
jgi:hypothetical protein